MRVAVLAGGRSSEHEVSLESAASVLEGLEAGGHETVPIVIDRDGRWLGDPRDGDATGFTRADARRAACSSADVVFPVLHGPFGEDGTVQGLLECARRALRRRGRAGLGAVHGQGARSSG